MLGAIPYFEAVEGVDGKWWWAQCPICGEVVLNDDGGGAGRHWFAAKHQERETERLRPLEVGMVVSVRNPGSTFDGRVGQVVDKMVGNDGHETYIVNLFTERARMPFGRGELR